MRLKAAVFPLKTRRYKVLIGQTDFKRGRRFVLLPTFEGAKIMLYEALFSSG